MFCVFAQCMHPVGLSHCGSGWSNMPICQSFLHKLTAVWREESTDTLTILCVVFVIFRISLKENITRGEKHFPVLTHCTRLVLSNLTAQLRLLSIVFNTSKNQLYCANIISFYSASREPDFLVMFKVDLSSVFHYTSLDLSAFQSHFQSSPCT